MAHGSGRCPLSPDCRLHPPPGHIHCHVSLAYRGGNGPLIHPFRYVVAIWLGHVEIEFPYISDTGTHTPESCIFSQMLNIVSFLVALTMYVRYKQVEQYYRDHLSPESSRILAANVWSLWIGWVSAFGLSIVANFQETSVFRVHMVSIVLLYIHLF